MHFFDRHKAKRIMAAFFNELVGERFNLAAQTFSFFRFPCAAVFNGGEVRVVLAFGADPIEAKLRNSHVNDMGSGVKARIDRAAFVVNLATHRVTLSKRTVCCNADVVNYTTLVQADFLEYTSSVCFCNNALIPTLAATTSVEASLIKDKVKA